MPVEGTSLEGIRSNSVVQPCGFCAEEIWVDITQQWGPVDINDAKYMCLKCYKHHASKEDTLHLTEEQEKTLEKYKK